jgi:hypothetical protein
MAGLALVLLAAGGVAAADGDSRTGTTLSSRVGTAGIDADTVDGRDAVGAGAGPGLRAGKLVATNAAGYLPADIIRIAADADRLDGLDSRAFARRAALRSDAGAVNQADNPVHWKQLKGVPAGLADGRDAAGIRGITITTAFDSQRVEGLRSVSMLVPCPAGHRVVGGGYNQTSNELRIAISAPAATQWFVNATNYAAYETILTVYAICLATDPPNALAASRLETTASVRHARGE